MVEQSEDRTATLKIGAVARLTGLSAHTLRKWEDRYRTAGGERLYTKTDLRRLALIKTLAETGMSLRDLCRLSLEELERTREQVLSDAGVPTGVLASQVETVRIGVIGDALPALLERGLTVLKRVELVATGEDVDALDRALGGRRIDILVWERPSVETGTRHELERYLHKISARGGIVVYGFGAQSHVREVRSSNVALMRAPVDPGELERIALGLVYDIALGPTRLPPAAASAEADEIPSSRLTNREVTRIAARAPRVECECPHHLADLILGLRAFEQYSAACESRNTQDAALHHDLWVTTAKARAAFEDALMRIAEAEGISLD